MRVTVAAIDTKDIKPGVMVVGNSSKEIWYNTGMGEIVGRNMLANVQEVTFVERGDERGKLIALETHSEFVPFEVKRVYFIYDTMPDTVRGKHAHRQLRQMLICVSGVCTIECEMPDGTKSEHRLDWPNKGLLIDGLVWHNMKEFSKDAVLLVLASEHYDAADYIRDYDEVKKIGALMCDKA